MPTYKMNLAVHMRQARQAEREYLDLLLQEIACWRMFGIDVEFVGDEVLIRYPHRAK